MKKLITLLGACAFIVASPATIGHEYYAKSFKVIHPWAEPSANGDKNAAVYVVFDEISGADKLLAAHTTLAGKVELRGAGADGGEVLRKVDLVSGKTLTLGPDGAHLLLIDLKAPLQTGRSYPMTLEFEKAGPVQVMISIGAH
jgi:copper(I)-binding protein